MAVARVVTFEGVSADRMAEMNREMESGEPPDHDRHPVRFHRQTSSLPRIPI